MSEELWTPDEKPKDTAASFRFPPKIMLSALQIADRAIKRAEEPRRLKEKRRSKRMAAKRARRLNRA